LKNLRQKKKNEMAGKVKSDYVIEQLQRAMALEKSSTERPNDSEKRHVGCAGHVCSPACGFEGYCDFEATRYYQTDKGQTEGEYNKGERHDYYRRHLRLGYDY
jgi:hypothetical protein